MKTPSDYSFGSVCKHCRFLEKKLEDRRCAWLTCKRMRWSDFGVLSITSSLDSIAIISFGNEREQVRNSVISCDQTRSCQ